MNKKVFIVFLVIFEILLVYPALGVQERINGYRLLVTSLPLPFHYYMIQSEDPQNFSLQVEKLITLAEEAEVNLFFSNAYNAAEKDFSFTAYVHLQDQRYLDRFPIRGPKTLAEFHSSDRVFSQKDNSLLLIKDQDIPKDLTSLKNLKEPLLGSLVVSAENEQSLAHFALLFSAELPEITLERRVGLEEHLTPLPFFLEYYKWLWVDLSELELGLYGVFCAILLYLLITISHDARKVAIKKANGYSDGSIVMSYIRQYVPPVLLLGPFCFTVGYFLYGAKPVASLFFPALLNYLSVLLVFSCLICLLTLLTMFFITAIRPAELVKGRKSQKTLIAYTAFIKIALVLLLVPGLVLQIADFQQTWQYVKYSREEAKLFSGAYRVYASPQIVASLDYAEFYRKAVDTGIAFSSISPGDVSYIAPESAAVLIITNSQMFNQQKLTAGGKLVELDPDKQYLILSSDINVDRAQRYMFKTEYFSLRDWQKRSSEEVETIVLDPGQKFPAMIFDVRSPNPSQFILTVDTELPINLKEYFYIGIDDGQAARLEELLNQGLEQKIFSLIPFELSLSGFASGLRIFRVTLSCVLLLLASVLATVLFHGSIIEISKQKLVILNVHGASPYRYVQPLLIALAGSALLGWLSWPIIKGKKSWLGVAPWQLVAVLVLLGILEVVIWAVSIGSLSRKKVQVLHGE